MKVVKIKIYQPQAHYRIPFTYQRRHTYPIPPFSTVVGMLCNVLGIRNLKGEGEPDNEEFKRLKNVKLAIAGKFSSKTTEYVWFRNLSKKSHDGRFGFSTNRRLNGEIEHPGGQQPVYIDILNDVHLWIYVYHEDEEFLKRICEALKNPRDRLYPLHLGRAEDLVVIKDISLCEVSEGEVFGHKDKFFWVPEDKVDYGLIYRMPTFYRLINGTRVFEFTKVKLVSSGFTGNVKTHIDENDDNVPLFLIGK